MNPVRYLLLKGNNPSEYLLSNRVNKKVYDVSLRWEVKYEQEDL